MIKQGQIISFKSVAQSANVSTAYLYKQSNLRTKIETLRGQQKQRPLLKQPLPASDNSKSVIISNLREENKKLRAEIDGLRRINEGLAGRVYHLQGADDLAQRLKAENADLKQQLAECRQLVQKFTPVPVENPKVISLEQKRAGRSNRGLSSTHAQFISRSPSPDGDAFAFGTRSRSETRSRSGET